MRIIAGEFKGRIIDSPSERTTRPTTDRVRESIFSSIYSRLPVLDDVNVLDAFAGSGALGIEALSRGAQSCTFVEHDRVACKILEENLKKLKLNGLRACVISADAFDLPARLKTQTQQAFKLILLDPPYAYEAQSIHDLLDALSAQQLLAKDCVIVYEHALTNMQLIADIFAQDAFFEQTGQKKYGKIGVTYFSYKEQ